MYRYRHCSLINLRKSLNQKRQTASTDCLPLSFRLRDWPRRRVEDASRTLSRGIAAPRVRGPESFANASVVAGSLAPSVIPST